MGVYGVNWVRIGCMRCRDERLGGRAESWTDLCHPAFAMAGALAWQVKKISIKKITSFVVWRGDSMGLFWPRVSPPVCGVPSFLCCVVFVFALLLTYAFEFGFSTATTTAYLTAKGCCMDPM